MTLVLYLAHKGQEYIYLFFNVAEIFRQSDIFKSLPFDIMMVKITYYASLFLSIPAFWHGIVDKDLKCCFGDTFWREEGRG